MVPRAAVLTCRPRVSEKDSTPTLPRTFPGVQRTCPLPFVCASTKKWLRFPHFVIEFCLRKEGVTLRKGKPVIQTLEETVENRSEIINAATIHIPGAGLHNAQPGQTPGNRPQKVVLVGTFANQGQGFLDRDVEDSHFRCISAPDTQERRGALHRELSIRQGRTATR